MSNLIPVPLECRVFIDASYVEICENVFRVTRTYISREKDKKIAKEAAYFSVSFLHHLRLFIYPGFDNNKVKRLLREVENNLLVSDTPVHLCNHPPLNGLYRDIPIALVALNSIADRLIKYDSPESINKKRRCQGYYEILVKLYEEFDELSIRPYSQ
jgi:hypothetical protein